MNKAIPKALMYSALQSSNTPLQAGYGLLWCLHSPPSGKAHFGALSLCERLSHFFVLVPYLCSALLAQKGFGSSRLRVGLCEQSPAVPPVRARQLQLLQQGPATARAELWVMLVVLWASRLKKKLLCYRSWENGVRESQRETALQPPRSAQLTVLHGADLSVQPWRSTWCSSGWGLKKTQPVDTLTGAAWARAAARGGAEGACSLFLALTALVC